MTTDHPLLIDTRLLHRQPGASKQLTVAVTADDDVRNEVMAVPGGSELTVSLLLESVLDGILVTGTTTAPTRGVCVRCLDPVADQADIEFRQFFVYPGAEVAEEADDDADVTELTGQYLDLRPAFRDALVLALPLRPTCRPDCPGLCQECGFRLADDPGHRHDHPDPRWSQLAHLRERLGPPERE